MESVVIRYYRPSDREGVRKICADTSAKIYTVKPKLRECMCNMYVDYYIEQEPENVLVAEEATSGYICGYIVASTDPDNFIEKQKRLYSPLIRKKRAYLGWFNSICAFVSAKLDKLYGGGFHINVAPDRQGEGLGAKLLTSMGVHLKNRGVKFMYLVTKNRKTRGYGFYSHYGFKEVKSYFLGSLALTFDLDGLDEKIKKYL